MDSASLQRLYYLTPVWLQDIAVSMLGLRNRAERYGPAFERILDQFMASEYASNTAIAEYQLQKRKDAISNALKTPYYANSQRHLFSDVLCDLESRWGQLPILTKAQVKAAGSSIYNPDVPDSATLSNRTSGTTGVPLRIRLCKSAWRSQWAVAWRHRARVGISRRTRHLSFGARVPVNAPVSSPPFWRWDYFNNRIYCSSHHVSRSNLKAFLGLIERMPDYFVTGYPSVVSRLASLLRDEGLTVKNAPLAFVSASDQLYTGSRKVIGEVFRTKVTDFYGSAEFCATFSECEAGAYHLDHEVGYVELLGEGSKRRIIATGLLNGAMPLIRYDTGDGVELFAEGPAYRCPCGRSTLAVRRIFGREDEYLILRDGGRVIGLNQVLEYADNIDRIGLIQLDYDEVEIVFSPTDSRKTVDLTRVIFELQKRMGRAAKITTRAVKMDDFAAVGKNRSVMRQISESHETA
jgi:phenylacetate-CoA ligase